MKFLLIISIFLISSLAQARDWKNVYVAIASSGSGGSIMGHSYLLFCKDRFQFKLKNCQAVEYNLDINLGEKYKETLKLSTFEKFEALDTAKFQIFIHDDAEAFQQKYYNRDQDITYYIYNGGIDKINTIYSNLMLDRELRNSKDFFDYSITNNNCATTILDAFKAVEDDFDFFKEHDFYDIDQYLFQFPIYLQDTIERSGLFPSAIEVFKNGWRSFRVN
jgi:hypothetical protein